MKITPSCLIWFETKHLRILMFFPNNSDVIYSVELTFSLPYMTEISVVIRQWT